MRQWGNGKCPDHFLIASHLWEEFMDAQNLGYVHRFVPAAPAGSGRTLLLLHGTGGDENDLLELGRRLSPNAALLSPRGNVLERGMPRFFRRLAEGVFDLEDLTFRTQELADFVEAASATYGFDAGKVFAVGYSNGANIAASILLLRPRTLAGAILFRPMVPFVPESLPDLTGKPVFLAAGRYDPIVPPDNTEQLAALLRRCDADVTLRWQDGSHALSGEEIEAARMWLAAAEQQA
jgi:phospholipase/carboxylesterase/glyoxalase family protein